MEKDEERQIAKILISEIKWIIADETRGFDDYFKLPIINIEHTVEKLREFYVWRENVDGATPITDVDAKFVEALTSLTESGEDIKKLANWISSTQDTDTSNDDGRYQWQQYFETVHESTVGSANDHINADIVSVAQSYMRSINTPLTAFHQQCKQSAVQWLNSNQNRSEFDNYLWDTHFGQFNMSPVGMQRHCYAARLLRCWWMVESVSVANGVREEMYEGLVNLGTSRNDSWLWQETRPIDLVFGWNCVEII